MPSRRFPQSPSDETRMNAIHYQRILAFIFLGLGGWCLLFPGTVEVLGLKPEHRMDTVASHLLVGCFGAQAVLCGILLVTARFTPRTFLVFGLAGSIPFFVFNYWFYFVVPVFSHWMLLDFVGNVGIFVLSMLGYRAAVREQKA
jgi:hypothetical protein